MAGGETATVDNTPTWRLKAAEKRKAEYAKIPSEWRLANEYLQDINEHSDQSVIAIPAKCGILSSSELEITEAYTAVSLADAVQSGSLKAVDVATAFCKRAAVAQQLCNCLTETFFDDAIARGKWLDDYLAQHKKPLGPLHGVPVSIKDSFSYVGVASTLGYVSFLDNPLPTKNSPLVDILLELGAILYCKTNIPQSLMTGDSDNNVFGKVLNPHKLKLGAGGSSGGEGALVAMRGSILGVGTDIGGSIRIPALCDGTYGFKPSTARIPYAGQTAPGRRGSPGFVAVAGPLANSLDDLTLFIKSVIGTKPWDKDPSTIVIPWRTDAADAPLEPRNVRVGYFIDEAELPAHPPVKRAIETAVAKLEKAGFTLVKLASFPGVAQGLSLARDWFNMEPEPKRLRQIVGASGEPLIESILRNLAAVVPRPDGFTVNDIYDANVARQDYRSEWHDVWMKDKLDVILCPGAQTTAVLHDDYGEAPYTTVFNLLEYPGIIIPVGTADASIDKDELATPDSKRPCMFSFADGMQSMTGSLTYHQTAPKTFMARH